MYQHFDHWLCLERSVRSSNAVCSAGTRVDSPDQAWPVPNACYKELYFQRNGHSLRYCHRALVLRQTQRNSNFGKPVAEQISSTVADCPLQTYSYR